MLAMGCGGGGDESAATPTKAEFIKRADGICAQTDEKQKAILQRYVKNHPGVKPNKAVEENIALATLPSVKVEVEELDDLSIPSGDVYEVQAIIDGIEKAVEEAEADPSKMLKGSSREPFKAVDELAAKYGFKACAFPA